MPKQTTKLTAAFPLPHVTSKYDIAEVQEIQAALALPLTAEQPSEQEGAGMDVV